MHTTNHLIQLKISLRRSEPVIWRQMLVYDTISFHHLNYAIQLCMGWVNRHLYEYKVFDYIIGIPSPELKNIVDAKTVTLGSVITEAGEKFGYTYDFGDNWEHSVEAEAILPIDHIKIYPRCIGGKMNCPPEDCGGIPGFYNMLEIFKDRKHPEYRDMRAWAGKYKPEKFDVEKTNKKLNRLPQYMGESEW